MSEAMFSFKEGVASERAQRANEIPVLHVPTPCSCMLRDVTAFLFNAAKTDIMMSRRGISRQVAAALSCRDFFRRRVVAAAARPTHRSGFKIFAPVSRIIRIGAVRAADPFPGIASHIERAVWTRTGGQTRGRARILGRPSGTAA